MKHVRKNIKNKEEVGNVWKNINNKEVEIGHGREGETRRHGT